MRKHSTLLILLGMLFSAPAAHLAGQAASVGESAGNSADSPIMMSTFEVNTTQDTGYVTKNSATAFKTDEALIGIPQPVLVVTRDMISDTGYGTSSDVLAFAGVADYFRGESYELRGARVSYDLVDEMPDLAFFQDNIFVDSYEVIRGPTAVFYPTATLGGIILKTTRKPMVVAQTSVTIAEDQFGMFRLEFDSTGPLTKLGRGVLAYRVEGAYQDGRTYFNNFPVFVEAIHPSFEYIDANNRLLVAFDLQNLRHITNGTAILTPDGGIYSGAGRQNEYNLAPEDGETFRYTALRIEFEHKISTDWEMKLKMGVTENRFHGVYSYISEVDWTRLTADYTYSYEDNRYTGYNFVNDYTGKYDIFNFMEGRSTFGLNYQMTNNIFRDLIRPPTAPTGWNNVPLNEPVQNFMQLPPLSQWTLNLSSPYDNSDDGNSFSRTYFDAYYQQEFDLLHNRLSLVGGETWRYLATNQTTGGYIAPNVPYTTNNTVLSLGLYRYGVVLQLIPQQLAIYALDTTYAASNGADEDAQRQVLPPEQGKGTEVGFKADLLGDRLTATIALYKEELSNVGMYIGNNAANQEVYVAEVGTVQRGWDSDVAYKVTDNLQFVATFYKGTVVNSSNQELGNTYTGMWSLFGKYDFPVTALKGLAVGGGASEIMGRTEQPATTMIFSPAQQAQLLPGGSIRVKSEVLLNAFVNYRFARHWLLSVSVANLLDNNFAQGSQGGVWTDPSPPRDFALKVGYQF